jgi:hypothetical protein
MAPSTTRHCWAAVAALAARQNGVVARWQLLSLGFTADGVRHLLRSNRVLPVARGVYAVGRRELGQLGEWTAAVLACGPGALLSHGSGAKLWGIGDERSTLVEISVTVGRPRRRPGVVVHRRSRLRAVDRAVHRGVPVTSVAATVVDLASYLPTGPVERAIREADKLGLVDADELRVEIGSMPQRPGIRALRAILDRLHLVLTDSELERRFLPLAAAAGLPVPQTQAQVNGYRVDFYWPELGLVVETDGLTYHRTPSQQARDRVRDNTHLAAGLTPLRFTHAQVTYEPGYVRGTLAVTARRLRALQAN